MLHPSLGCPPISSVNSSYSSPPENIKYNGRASTFPIFFIECVFNTISWLDFYDKIYVQTFLESLVSSPTQGLGCVAV